MKRLSWKMWKRLHAARYSKNRVANLAIASLILLFFFSSAASAQLSKDVFEKYPDEDEILIRKDIGMKYDRKVSGSVCSLFLKRRRLVEGEIRLLKDPLKGEEVFDVFDELVKDPGKPTATFGFRVTMGAIVAETYRFEKVSLVLKYHNRFAVRENHDAEGMEEIAPKSKLKKLIESKYAEVAEIQWRNGVCST